MIGRCGNAAAFAVGCFLRGGLTEDERRASRAVGAFLFNAAPGRRALTGYPFPYLIDMPEDGAVEDHGYLPLDAALTPGAAAKEFTRVFECWDDDGQMFTCSGVRQWLRPVVYDYFDFTREARPARVEDILDGRDETVRFHKCEPTDIGAAEWWLIEAVPRCDRYDGERDFYCRLPEGHEEGCAA